MKNRSILLVLSIFLILGIPQLFGQKLNPSDPIEIFVPTRPNVKLYKAGKSFYQQKENWREIIDLTWGPGDPYEKKIEMFEAYVKALDDHYPMFPNLSFDWDSLKTYFRNEIDSTTSRGRFAAIMSHLSYKLQELHTAARDSSVLFSPLNPGTPILVLGSLNDIKHFGAGLTILEDSTIAVFKVVDNHPLNLEPGDIIVGYEGVPWKELVEELLAAELPIAGYWGGSQSAYFDAKMICAGMNWHLFETIDIKKYSTGQVVSLPTASMLSLVVEQDWLWNNEQFEISNIPFPVYEWDHGQNVTYGILENTNIGFIYLIAEDWENNRADNEFFAAVDALKETDGLIIDMRYNLGGWALFPGAFNILYNYSKLYTIDDAYRCSPSTWDMCVGSEYTEGYAIKADPNTFYEKPIAVLIGPSCVSMGDLTTYRLKYHPNVRLFGKSSNASLSENTEVEGYDNWRLRYAISDMVRLENPSYFLNQKEVPLDYPLWFELDDIANNYDTVLEEAKKYVMNLTHSHNVQIDGVYSRDQITFNAEVFNPKSHSFTVTARIESEFEFIDSMKCEIINNKINETISLVDYNEDFYSISLTTKDNDDSTKHTLPNIVRFTTAGPIKLDSWEVSQINDLNRLRISNISAVNQSLTKTIDNVIVKFYSEDSSVTKISGIKNFSTLLPQEIKAASGSIYVDVDKLQDYTFIAEISSNNIVYWKDTIEYNHSENLYVPTDYAIIQDAIDAADSGDVVIIEEGTYYQQFSFKGKAITIGSRYLLDDSTSHIENTIIDGSTFSEQDSASIVSFISGEDSNSVLCGLTLQNANGTYGFEGLTKWRTGGAIIMDKSGGTIRKNIFKNNSILFPSFDYVIGGGIDCILLPEDKTVIIENNTFLNNKVEGKNSWGGAINCENSSGRVRIEKNIVIKNSVKGTLQCNGGGISVVVGNNNKITISNNYVNKNVVNGGADDGGGIFAMNCKVDILNNIITENSCYGTTKGSGGGISVGNWAAENPSKSIANITNNTIIDNNAQHKGSGIFVNSMPVSIMNNIIRNNSDPTETQINIMGSYTKKVEYSNIEGGFTGEGNIDSNPMFCDSSMCLLPFEESPCIDAGNPDKIYNDRNNDPLYPARGTLRNDMGAFGGPHSRWAEMSILPGDPLVSVENLVEIIPNEYSLEQNYPNPFNPSTTIKYQLPINVKSETENVKLIVYDILGREVATLVNEKQKPGYYEVEFNCHSGACRNLTSGVYFYKLSAGEFIQTKKMIMLK